MKKPTSLDLAVGRWGFEDPRTIAIAYLEEEGAHELAEDLWRVCSEGDPWEGEDRIS